MLSNPPVTCLRILNGCLSGRGRKIFPNQVVLYNALFGATNPDVLPGKALHDLERILGGRHRASDEKLIKKVNYLLRNGLDSNSANVGKHINNAPELPIPRQHKAHFLVEEQKEDIIHRLKVIIQFCLADNPGHFSSKAEGFDDLLHQLKSKLSDVSPTLAETEELSIDTLAVVIYEVVIAYLTTNRTLDFPLPHAGSRRKVNLMEQWEEYMRKVDCFGSGNVDRYFAMRRLARTNVVAANELACMYFYGAKYHETEEGDGNSGVYVIQSDPDMAAHYFKIAANCDPPVVNACWSLGYMIWNRMFEEVQEEEAEYLAGRYFGYAMERGYLPAFNSVGLMELSKGNALLSEEERLREQGYSFSEEKREQMLRHFCRGLELCDQAGCQGWVYGHINVADFLADPRYQESVWPAIRDRVRLEGPAELRARWQAAADLENLWATSQLAMLDCKLGNIDSAVALWEKAASYRYPTASYNLAHYIYGSGCPRHNEEKYLECLKAASADGSEKAAEQLEQMHLWGR